MLETACIRAIHEAFAGALHAAGFYLSGAPVIDGTWQRAPVEGDQGWRKSGRYVGYLDGRPAGCIQNFKSGYAEPWVSEREMPAFTALQGAQLVRKRELRAVERSYSEAHAERRSYAAWQSAEPASPDHPYLVRKGVALWALKQDTRGNLAVPARDVTGWLGTVQTISPDGVKLFPKDAAKVRRACLLDDVTSHRPLLIAEGYATTATLHEATGLPALAVFDSGNLPPVAQAWRDQHPHRRMVTAADNDHGLLKRSPPLPNVGRDKAAEAA